MRLFYAAFLIFLTAPIFSQNLQFGPVQGNALLRSHAAKQAQEKAQIAERLTGIDPRADFGDRVLGDCPPEAPLGTILVESGSFIVFEVDTFGYGISGFDGYLELLDGPDFNFGTANIADSTIILEYFANDGLIGINNDTLQIKYSEPGHAAIFEVVITVVRPGKTVVADGVSIDPGEVIQYCLDDELDFSSPKSCSVIESCLTNYDGEDNRSFHFSSYNYPDTCIVYYGSRFPGTDTLCIRICDELTVCDLFKIPVTVVGDTVKISSSNPFFDDFSNTTGPYPSSDNWLDDDVFVNTTFAKNPPSLGMVTFDGLDKGGSPYDLINGGVGDMLTSKAIDLSSFGGGDDVYLRFFFAPKGYGLAPELDDSFSLEFRNKQREWVNMTTYAGVDTLTLADVPDFEFVAVKIDDADFLHDAFQFRFVARSSPGGYGDWWHLDYIHLGNGSTEVNNFPDLAFATTPNSFLKNYTSIPLKHLKADLEGEVKNSEELNVSISNRRIDQSVSFQDSEIDFSESTLPQPLSGAFTVADAGSSLTSPLAHKSLLRVIPTANRTSLISGINSLPSANPLNIEGIYSFIPNQNEDANYEVNNTVKSKTILSDYFAHDDGSAEIQFFVQFSQGGEQIATGYKANVTDTLKAVRFMFPHFITEDFESQLFNLQVWIGEPDDEPEYERELLRPIYPDNLIDTLQGFTTYRLEDFFGEATPLVIPAGSTFYVGWEQITPAETGIPVGLDLTNQCGCNKANLGNGWINFPTSTFNGSLMVRPVFGETVSTINSIEESKQSKVSLLDVYPNPASEILNIDFKDALMSDYNYMVINQIGQTVMQGQLDNSLEIGQLADGYYYLQTLNKKTGEIWVNRFVVSKN